jgi:hypothetical protein
VVKGGGIPEDWKRARTRKIDRKGRWTLKRDKKKPTPPGGLAGTAEPEIAMPMFGGKNHVGLDREHGFVRRFTVTHAATDDRAQLGAVLDPANTASSVWAATAYRSAANIALLERRGLVPQFQRVKPRGKPMPSLDRPRQRPARPHPLARRARLRRPEAPLRPRHPHHRQSPRHGEAGAGQSRLQLHPPCLAADPRRPLTAAAMALPQPVQGARSGPNQGRKPLQTAQQ